MASGLPDQTQTVPVQISNTVFNPVPTSAINLSANLPATPTSPTTSTQVMIYDSLGNQQAIDLNWTRNSQDNWTLQIDAPGDIALQNRGSVDLVFGTTSGNPVAAGTIGLLNNQTGSVTPTAFSSGGDSSFTFTADFGAGAQTITLDLGSFGSSNGVTQFAGTDYNIRNATQDGVPPGAYSSLSMKPNGDVVVNYDNGQTKTIARVPLANFRDADKLQREDGQAFTQTLESGTATLNQSNSNGAGQIVTGSLEASNVDIASEFTKLIVAQRAYSANAKIVTTADDMLQETMSMKR
jgi:flagellar hook protein FlgE